MALSISFTWSSTFAGIILVLTLTCAVVTFPLVLKFRNYPSLRDVRPCLVMVQHVGGFFIILNYFLAAFDADHYSCVVNVMVECGACLLVAVPFATRHYMLHVRFRSVVSALPAPVFSVLLSFPFVIIATIRMFGEHTPLTVCYGSILILIVLLVRLRYYLDYHPSTHFMAASHFDFVGTGLLGVILIVRQYVDENLVHVIFLTTLAAIVNLSHLLYIAPPLRMKLGKRDEYAVTVYAGNETANSPTENVLPINDNSSWWFGKAVSKLINTPTQQSSSTTLANTHRQTSPELRAFLDLIHEGDLRRVQQYVNSVSLSVVCEQDETGRTAPPPRRCPPAM